MISATRLLLAAALAEPFNQRFRAPGGHSHSFVLADADLSSADDRGEKSRMDACGPHGGFHVSW